MRCRRFAKPWRKNNNHITAAHCLSLTESKDGNNRRFILHPVRSAADYLRVFSKSFGAFQRKEPLGLAAASAFFTSFALPPLLIILISLFGLIFNKHVIRDQLYEHLSMVLGSDSAEALHNTSRGFLHLASNPLFATIGFLFLLFVATTLFNQLTRSFNSLWNIQVHSGKGFGAILKPRFKSLIAIIFTGVIFLAHLKVESLQLWIFTNMGAPGSGKRGLFIIISDLLSVLIFITWFSFLFRYMASAHPTWQAAWGGGILTGILYSIGAVILGRLLDPKNIQAVFGFSGSFVGILLYVFYVSLILFYGWIFTRNLADLYEQPVKLDQNAYEFNVTENRK